MDKDRDFLMSLSKSLSATIEINTKEIAYQWKKSDNDGRYYDETSDAVARLEGAKQEASDVKRSIDEYLKEGE